MSVLRNTLRVFLPLVVLVGGVALTMLLVSLRPEPEVAPRSDPAPLVEVVTAETTDIELVVRAHGTVVPRTQSRLVAEVSGRIVSVSPRMVNGGFFEADEVLLEIDPVDYRVAVEEARSRVAVADLRLAQEEADAEIAVEDWKRLGLGEPDDLVLRKPQLADARAQLAAAKAALAKAQRDIERCTIRAPYPGRVRMESVDAGQYVNKNEELARVYAVDFAEVRLPLPDAELAYVDLPLAYRPSTRPASSTGMNGSNVSGHAMDHAGPRVTLSAHFARRTQRWHGRIVRTEGEIDPATRMVVAVARVEDPYGRAQTVDRPPLAVGLFVEAEIEGKLARDVVVLPRSVLRGVDQVYVVDADDRLRFRQVDVLKAERDRIVLASGIAAGDRVVTTPLEATTDGMRVRVEARDSAVAGTER